MGTLRQDIRWALQVMRKNLGLTIAVVFSLGLAIGANTAVFSVVNAFLLRPLAIDDIDRMVRVREDYAQPGGDPDTRSVSAVNYFLWKEHNTVFQGMAAATGMPLTLTGDGPAEQISGAAVSADFFPLLGIEPIIGRTFSPEEDVPGRNRVVLLGYNLWRSRFGGDRNVLGKVLTLNGQPHEVIGVMQLGLRHPYEADMWVPLALVNDPSNDWSYYVPARLKPGITLERAQAEMAALVRRLAEQYPTENGPTSANLSPIREELVHDLDQTLFLLAAAAAFVLLIACVNVSNLLLAQSLNQTGEVAVRVALGATRPRLIRQYLTYSILLAAIGGAVGVLLTFWSVQPLVALGPVEALGEFDIEPRLDWVTLGFTLLASLIVGVIFGLVPALRASRANPNDYLREGGSRSRTLGTLGRRLLSSFVIAEVALAVVLLVGAGLVVQSFRRLAQENRGFETDKILAFEVAFSEEEYPETQQRIAYLREALEVLRRLPGVTTASATTTQPLNPGQIYAGYNVEGRPANNARGFYITHHRAVAPGYLQTLGIPLLQGRDFTEADNENSPPVLIVSKSFADRHWPGENPIGKRVKRGAYDSDNPWMTVVGVAGTLKETREVHDLEMATDDAWYMPFAQPTVPYLDWMVFVVKTRDDPAAIVPEVRQALGTIDPDLPIADVATMDERLHRLTSQDQLNATIYGALGFFGLVLAALGIYSVLSFSVNQRLRELGIRAAMGAQPSQLKKLILSSALRLTVVGLVLGAAGAFVLTRFLAAQLYQIDARDPLTLTGTLVVLGLIALLSSYMPARRAARIDPVRALRYE